MIRTPYMLKSQNDQVVVIRQAIEIALARCQSCGARIRVLPCDLLPRKLYSLEVVEHSLSLYNRGDHSLRQVVRDELGGERTPAAATVHGWSEGIGAYALGRRVGEVLDASPASRIFAEAEKRFPAARAASAQSSSIHSDRARSQARKERLLAGQTLLGLALAVGLVASAALAHLNGAMIGWGATYGLGFSTGLCNTLIEHIPNSRSTRDLDTVGAAICGRSPPTCQIE